MLIWTTQGGPPYSPLGGPYRRTNHDNFHVHGFRDEGATTTPFDMAVRNGLDRFHLAMAVIDRVPGLLDRAAHARQHFCDRLIEHDLYVREHGEDMRDIRAWLWPRLSAKAG